MCVGVILGFPPDIARELQEWRASFGDPMAEVIPAHITLITTTPTQDWAATREHVRDVARTPGTLQDHHLRAPGPSGLSRLWCSSTSRKASRNACSCTRNFRAVHCERMLPFPYHPHVTVAHDVAQENLDEAETVLKRLPGDLPCG